MIIDKKIISRMPLKNSVDYICLISSVSVERKKDKIVWVMKHLQLICAENEYIISLGIIWFAASEKGW